MARPTTSLVLLLLLAASGCRTGDERDYAALSSPGSALSCNSNPACPAELALGGASCQAVDVQGSVAASAAGTNACFARLSLIKHLCELGRVPSEFTLLCSSSTVTGITTPVAAMDLAATPTGLPQTCEGTVTCPPAAATSDTVCRGVNEAGSLIATTHGGNPCLAADALRVWLCNDGLTPQDVTISCAAAGGE